MGETDTHLSQVNLVLDSNVFVADFRMSGSGFHTLLNELVRTGHKLYVPQVVVDEAVNKYREWLKKCKDNIDKEIRDLNKRAGISNLCRSISDRRIDELVGNFEDVLTERLLSVDAQICPYPDVTHEELVERALRRRKPFSENGRGYRDALIWETVRDIARNTTEPVVFVTDNVADFCTSDDALHSDLCADLTDYDISPERVSVIRKLDAFVDQYVKPWLEKLDNVKAQLSREEYPGFNLSKEVQKAIPSHLQGALLYAASLGFPPQYEDPTVHEVLGVSDIQVTDVRRLSESDLLICVQAEVECTVIFFVRKAYFYTISPENAPYVWNADYDEQRVGAAASKQIRVEVWLTFDEKQHDVTWMSIESAWDQSIYNAS